MMMNITVSQAFSNPFGKYCILLLFALALSPMAAQDKTNDEFYPYSLGAGGEANQSTRVGFALGYGAAIDRYIAYVEGNGILLAGLKGYLLTDFASISGAEADVYIRLNMFRLGRGAFFSQLSWGYTSYKEDDIHAQTLLADFTLGYRGFFSNGFYIEPYFRAGFPFRMAFGLMAGHRFAF